MTNDERYPGDLPISGDDFLGSGWRAALGTALHEGYPSMWQALSAAAKQAMAQQQQARGKVLWLLADACSMMLTPASVNEPFRPFMVIEGKRSVIPDDLADAEIEFFAEIVDEIDDPWLKARLADIVWLRGTKRDAKFALTAIDAYRSIPVDSETWVRGGQECWPRAIQLVRMLGRGAGDRLSEMDAAISSAFDSAGANDGFLGLWLADLMETNGLGHSRRAAMAQKLESLATEIEAIGDLHRAREFFGASARWFGLAENSSKAAAMTASQARLWVAEGAAHVSSQNSSYIAAAHCYENAIQVYRTIPRSERAALHVDERLVELQKRLGEAGEKSLAEMHVISSPGVDISKLVEASRRTVSGKELVEALRSFCGLYPGIDVKKARADAINRIREHPLSALFPATVMSSDGRVVAKHSGIGPGALADDDPTVRSEMIRDYGLLLGIVVQGSIWPALETLWLEHRLHEADFVGLAGQSPVVPKDRVRLFGKALYAGYDRDFVAALHLLVPQIEQLVRFHLKQAGAKTTNLDRNGIENELGLSSLMDLPEAGKVFGSNVSFEIKALFCDPFGPNLRNQLAHGLLGFDDCQSVYSVYAWWFGLKLTFNAFWVAAHRPEAGANEVAENGDGDSVAVGGATPSPPA